MFVNSSKELADFECRNALTCISVPLLMDVVKSRDRHYGILSGRGLEIGALHEPAQLASNCRIEYFDVRDKASSAKIFDELDPGKLVEVQHIGDVDQRDLRKLDQESFDFVIANHVIEHLANPIGLVEDMFRLVRRGGMVVISAPDKRFTFDRDRELTTFDHLLDDYKEGCVSAPDEHYLDFIEKVLPEGQGLDREGLQRLLDLVRKRREHVHVWDSEGFGDFMKRSLSTLGIACCQICEETGESNQIEYFGIWQKEKSGLLRGIKRFLGIRR